MAIAVAAGGAAVVGAAGVVGVGYTLTRDPPPPGTEKSWELALGPFLARGAIKVLIIF